MTLSASDVSLLKLELFSSIMSTTASWHHKENKK